MAARSLAQAIFGGKPIDPKEQAKSWRLKIKGEMRQLERQITKMSQDEQKILKEIKKAAKDGQMGGAKTLAKAVAFSRKGKERLLIAKSNLNTIEMKIAEQYAMMRVGASFEKSAEIMKLMNQAVRHEAVRDTMQELAKEMQKAELFDEMVDEAFADMDSEDVEAESEGQVAQVLFLSLSLSLSLYIYIVCICIYYILYIHI